MERGAFSFSSSRYTGSSQSWAQRGEEIEKSQECIFVSRIYGNKKPGKETKESPEKHVDCFAFCTWICFSDAFTSCRSAKVFLLSASLKVAKRGKQEQEKWVLHFYSRVFFCCNFRERKIGWKRKRKEEMQKERKKRKKHDRKLPIVTTWERM